MIRIIGDIHQRYDIYSSFLNVERSICLGDMGFDYTYLLENVDPIKHKFFGGNHDNYDKINIPHNLGDFGIVDNMFFVRGAWSIDREYRYRTQTPDNKLIWEEEELNDAQGMEALIIYQEFNGDIVLTHEAPLSIVKYVTNPKFAKVFGYEGVIKTRTNQLLNCFLEKPPKLWLFGHYHIKFVKKIGPTMFCCVNMESYIDLYNDFFTYSGQKFNF